MAFNVANLGRKPYLALNSHVAALAQIAAEELGVRYEDVWMAPCDSTLSPIDLGAYSSRVTLMAGNAIVLKPSEWVAWSSARFVDDLRGVLERCGHDPDLVQAVQDGVRRPLGDSEHVGRGLPTHQQLAQSPDGMDRHPVNGLFFHIDRVNHAAADGGHHLKN